MNTVRVALLGLYGVGNLGNEGSLDAFVSLLERTGMDAAPVVVAENPEIAEKSHPGLDAIPIAATLPRWTARLPHAVTRILQKSADVVHGFAIARSWDVLVVAGSGTFEKMGARPGGLPFDMFRLALVSRLRGKQFVLFGIGAEPNDIWLNRLLLRTTIRLADYVSLRDEFSRTSLVSMGARVGRCRVHPDLVYALDLETTVPRDPQLVVVGVMAYFGLRDQREHGHEIYGSYTDKLADFTAWLLAKGHRVRLVVGAHVDFAVAEEVEHRVRSRTTLTPEVLESVDVEDLQQLARETAEAALVVASRFHNVLVAVRTRTPTISLSYGPKNDVVLADAGLEGYSQPIENLDLDTLHEQFTRLYAAREAMSQEIARRTSGYGAAVEDAFRDMWRSIGERP